jgi:hypothetical protein
VTLLEIGGRLAVPAASLLLVMALAICWDRWREPRRDLRRPFTVVDMRTYRDASRRVDRLVEAGDLPHAWLGAVAICTWLAYERHFGCRARRARLAAEFDIWRSRQAELEPGLDLATGRTP